MTTEEWRPVPGFPGYEVSSLGRLMSSRRGTPRILSTPIGSKGYRTVRLSRGSRREQASFDLHRLMALTFFGPAAQGIQVRHLDGNCLNNVLNNLQYGTPGENNEDTLRHGTHRQVAKTHCPQNHPYDETNTYTKPTGARECRICMRARNTARRRRQGIPLRASAACPTS